MILLRSGPFWWFVLGSEQRPHHTDELHPSPFTTHNAARAGTYQAARSEAYHTAPSMPLPHLRMVRLPISLLPLLLLSALSILLLLATPAHALIEHLALANDRRAAFHIGSFGFEENGIFQMKLEVS